MHESPKRWQGTSLLERGGKPLHLFWLFHELYDHLGLAWEDLLRVGEIRVTVNASYDYQY
jgi:hypothetical protein